MLQDKNIQLEKFKNINLNDPFFESLKESYKEFKDWFLKKPEAQAYLIKDDFLNIQAFLYLKEENGEITDVEPSLPRNSYIKVGTFKINAHGTKLGERFVKKIFDYAISKNINYIYVTLFLNQSGLINLLEKFGFINAGKKNTSNGTEEVFLKQIGKMNGDVRHDYPLIDLNRNQYLLAIYPEFHTRLFPDSILKNENANIINDISHTNSIEKIYICKMPGVENLKNGDSLVIYRTKDEQGSAYYRAVATSICVVEEVKTKKDFLSLEEFLKYCVDRSVFTEAELREYYQTWYKIVVIKMTYNSALKNRIIRKRLIEEVGLNSQERWGFMGLTTDQFRHITKLGEVSANIIIN
jgi:hypothetical protein